MMPLTESDQGSSRDPEGYSSIRDYSYASRAWVYYDNAGQPFFIPSAVETYIQAGNDFALLSRTVNVKVNFANETIEQKVTLFNPIGAVSNQLTRIVSLAAGNTISEKDSDTYTKYGYNSSFLEFLGLASEVAAFANDGQKLRVTRFDEKTGWINASYPARVRTITDDLFNDITITAEKDALGLIHKETRKKRPSLERLFLSLCQSALGRIWLGRSYR